MTLGQRIAQKRKELGLSQEGLGEQLGVSRQAIYKWESDASLPEIEKLITLSKIFSVPVGWLLGVEEQRKDAPSIQPESSGELTETQLQMVQEIVERYLAAQPQPAPKKRRWLLWLLGGLAALFLLGAVMFSLFSRVDQVTQNYNSLQYSIYDIDRNVNSQIGSIANRVEEILKSQNNLTAEWSAQWASTDVRSNTAAFDVRAVPKTYVEGMTALFLANSDGDSVELPVEIGADGSFSAKITCPLSDYITISVVFVTGDKRETQLLNDFYGLYSDTFPDLWVHSWLWGDERDGVLPADNYPSVSIRNEETGTEDWRPAPPASLQFGLFRDRKLLFWYEDIDKEIIKNGVRTQVRIFNRQQEVTLEPGHTYEEAAVYTDELGRQMVYVGCPALEYNGSAWTSPSIYEASPDPADWEF